MSKIRITLFEVDTADGDQPNASGLIITEDRLVEQKLEFKNGPDKAHDGPIRIDTLLEDKNSAEFLIIYLQQLIGNLPISEKEKTRSSKQLNSLQPLATDSIQQLISDAFIKCKDQESLIDYLRGLNFAFFTYDHLKDICEKNEWPFKLKKKQIDVPKSDKGYRIKTLHGDYQFMARVMKLAKNPMNDKIDPQIFFGFKLIGEKRPKVLIYQLGKYVDTKELHWKEGEEVQFKVKEKFYKFPEPMTYKERANWRTEDRKVLFDPNKGTDQAYEPSKFYLRWKDYVIILKPQRTKKKR